MPLPPGAHLLPSKWVYEIKRSGIYKARYVARGDRQLPSEDYEDTFASVVRPETLRVIFALLASGNYEVKVWDVVMAFLNALLSNATPIYVCPLQGYEKYDLLGRLLIWFLL